MTSAWTEPPYNADCTSAENLVQRVEENIAFQRMIATLDGGGHDVKAAKMFPEAARGHARVTRRRQAPTVQATSERL